MKDLYIGYCRVSTTKQLDGGGIDRQVEKIEKFVQSRGREVSYWYQDDISGTKESRPSLDRMLLEIPELKTIADNVHIVIERNDRLARNVVVQELTILKFNMLGVSCFSAEMGIDIAIETPDNMFLRQIMGAAAGFDKNMTLAKLKAGRESKRSRLIAEGGRGKVEGRKGYLELLPAVYQDCIWLFENGKKEMYSPSSDKKFGYGRIAGVLRDMGYETLTGKKNVNGILTGKGGRITKSTVITILKTAGFIDNE